MSIKKFTAPKVRQTMKEIHAGRGLDPIILSNREDQCGVEVVAPAHAGQDTFRKAQNELWIKQVFERNLQVTGEADDIITKGGAYALIGPTGVGKTTTIAKLAARAVARCGADRVALLTTDSYRIGACEQLRIFGKIIGISVHAVKDADDLRLVLSALRHKHLLLIDTVGMGQRDGRVCDQKEMFDAVGVQCLLLLNAASSSDTLEEVVRMFRSKKVIGCIATKLDEAVNLGTVLDVAARHHLAMHYMTNGPQVPEDLLRFLD